MNTALLASVVFITSRFPFRFRGSLCAPLSGIRRWRANLARTFASTKPAPSILRRGVIRRKLFEGLVPENPTANSARIASLYNMLWHNWLRISDWAGAWAGSLSRTPFHELVAGSSPERNWGESAKPQCLGRSRASSGTGSGATRRRNQPELDGPGSSSFIV